MIHVATCWLYSVYVQSVLYFECLIVRVAHAMGASSRYEWSHDSPHGARRLRLQLTLPRLDEGICGATDSTRPARSSR